MEFCEKWGAIIVVENDKAFCPGCNHRPKKKPKIEASERIDKKVSVSVVKEGADITYPVVDMVCDKCHNKKAYFWTVQTRSSDESETKFYKCTKCSHTWRKYK